MDDLWTTSRKISWGDWFSLFKYWAELTGLSLLKCHRPNLHVLICWKTLGHGNRAETEERSAGDWNLFQRYSWGQEGAYTVAKQVKRLPAFPPVDQKQKPLQDSRAKACLLQQFCSVSLVPSKMKMAILKITKQSNYCGLGIYAYRHISSF